MIKAEWTNNDALSVEQTTKINDCISQQAEIISTVEGASEVRYPVFYAEKNAEKIRQLSSVQPEVRWIPVTEDKPRKCSNILVTDFNSVVEAYYDSNGNWFDLLGTELKGVTAWMPTPKPYREETEDE